MDENNSQSRSSFPDGFALDADSIIEFIEAQRKKYPKECRMYERFNAKLREHFEKQRAVYSAVTTKELKSIAKGGTANPGKWAGFASKGSTSISEAMKSSDIVVKFQNVGDAGIARAGKHEILESSEEQLLMFLAVTFAKAGMQEKLEPYDGRMLISLAIRFAQTGKPETLDPCDGETDPSQLHYFDDYCEQFCQDFIAAQKEEYPEEWEKYETYNAKLREHFEKHRIAYLSTNMEELESILENGLTPHPGKGADTADEVSHCTISPTTALNFGDIVLKFKDVNKVGMPLTCLPLPGLKMEEVNFTEVSRYGTAKHLNNYEVRMPYKSGAKLLTVCIKIADPDDRKAIEKQVDKVRSMGWDGTIELVYP